MTAFIGAVYPSPNPDLPHIVAIFRTVSGTFFVSAQVWTIEDGQQWLDSMLDNLNDPTSKSSATS